MTASLYLPTLSERLKKGTASEHDRVEVLMEKAAVFANKHNYAQHTLSQYYFQKDVEHLYHHPEVQKLIPDLDIRGRSQAALQDLADLGLEPQCSDIATEKVGYPEALGWIYVSEGSTLGAAFLFKQAQKHLGFSETFAARNLAAYPEGRAKVWKRFVEALDEAAFDPVLQDRVVQGALDAFGYFGKALSQLNELK